MDPELSSIAMDPATESERAAKPRQNLHQKPLCRLSTRLRTPDHRTSEISAYRIYGDGNEPTQRPSRTHNVPYAPMAYGYCEQTQILTVGKLTQLSVKFYVAI